MAYPIYFKRKVTDLSGIWDFQYLDGAAAPCIKDLKCSDFQFNTKAAVPGCFDAGIDCAGKRGIGVYRTMVTTASAGLMRLHLPGVTLMAKIFFDRKAVGLYDLPYSGMDFYFQAEYAGLHELIIAVDNRQDYQVSPLYSNYYDFYPFGGIIRPPALHELPEQYFDRCRITTVSLDPQKIRVEISMKGNTCNQFKGTIQIDQQTVSALELTGENGVFSTELTVPELEMWTPEKPVMHTLTLTTDQDAITERFGIRIVKAEKNQILINGKSYPLLGYNRHESHPEFGSAVPPQIMIEDLQILKDMNCNFVRGCHYPQSQDFLDLCDDLGMLVWEEALGWGDGENHLTDPFFQQKQMEQTELMLKNSMNHPSVIMFGYLNENRSDLPCCRELIGNLSALIRKTDPSRLVTFATCNFYADKALEFVDVVSTNLYPGWYGNTFDDIDPLPKIKATLADVSKVLSQSENAEKPWIISEIGAAALAGCHDRLKGPWSEDFQAAYIQEVCDFVQSDLRATGLALWQFMDCRSYKNSPHLNRARGFNNKGSLDEYRRPKMACDNVRKSFAAITDDRKKR